MNKCSKCGTEVAFCGKCGGSVVSVDIPAAGGLEMEGEMPEEEGEEDEEVDWGALESGVDVDEHENYGFPSLMAMADETHFRIVR